MRRPRILKMASALIIGVLAPSALPAQTPPPPSAEVRQAAHELFTLLFDRVFTQLNAQAVTYAWPQIEQALRGHNPKLDGATLAALRQEFERIRLARLHAVAKDLTELYARYLSAQEMNDLVAFYRTPSGAKVLNVIPQVLVEGFATVLPRMRSVTDDTQIAFLKLVRDRGLLKSQH